MVACSRILALVDFKCTRNALWRVMPTRVAPILELLVSDIEVIAAGAKVPAHEYKEVGMRVFGHVLLVAALAFLIACDRGPKYATEKIDVGMTQEEVKKIFGEPDKSKGFTGNSWVYFETVEEQTYRTVVVFDRQDLVRKCSREPVDTD